MDKIKQAIAALSDDGQPKGFFTKLITLTPIILTILATILAGLASSEMTQSMYHRSMAAQQQSKVGDQWAFFQAKRQRGALLESEVNRYPPGARPGKIDHGMLSIQVARLRLQLTKADADVKALLEKGPRPNTNLAERTAQLAAEANTMGKEIAAAMEHRLPYFDVLGGTKLLMLDVKDNAISNPVADAAKLIREHGPEAEISAAVMGLTDDAIAGAVRIAESNASQFEHVEGQQRKELEAIDTKVRQFVALAGQWAQHAAYFDRMVLESPSENAAVSEKSATVAAINGRVQEAAMSLRDFWSATMDDYNARRYRREADYNRRTAEVLEVRVRKSSMESDRHRERSRNFFFGMLAAQAGVAISSMAVAARKKSGLWVVASLAGAAALGISAWVYLSM